MSLQTPPCLSRAFPWEASPGPEWKSDPQFSHRYCFLLGAILSAGEEVAVVKFVVEEREKERKR